MSILNIDDNLFVNYFESSFFKLAIDYNINFDNDNNALPKSQLKQYVFDEMTSDYNKMTANHYSPNNAGGTYLLNNDSLIESEDNQHKLLKIIDIYGNLPIYMNDYIINNINDFQTYSHNIKNHEQLIIDFNKQIEETKQNAEAEISGLRSELKETRQKAGTEKAEMDKLRSELEEARQKLSKDVASEVYDLGDSGSFVDDGLDLRSSISQIAADAAVLNAEEEVLDESGSLVEVDDDQSDDDEPPDDDDGDPPDDDQFDDDDDGVLLPRDDDEPPDDDQPDNNSYANNDNPETNSLYEFDRLMFELMQYLHGNRKIDQKSKENILTRMINFVGPRTKNDTIDSVKKEIEDKHLKTLKKNKRANRKILNYKDIINGSFVFIYIIDIIYNHIFNNIGEFNTNNNFIYLNKHYLDVNVIKQNDNYIFTNRRLKYNGLKNIKRIKINLYKINYILNRIVNASKSNGLNSTKSIVNLYHESLKNYVSTQLENIDYLSPDPNILISSLENFKQNIDEYIINDAENTIKQVKTIHGKTIKELTELYIILHYIKFLMYLVSEISNSPNILVDKNKISEKLTKLIEGESNEVKESFEYVLKTKREPTIEKIINMFKINRIIYVENYFGISKGGNESNKSDFDGFFDHLSIREKIVPNIDMADTENIQKISKMNRLKDELEVFEKIKFIQIHENKKNDEIDKNIQKLRKSIFELEGLIQQ